jgi:hypothetical protein
MRRFLKNLFRDLQTTKTRPERRTPRTSLKLEGLEDRLVPAAQNLTVAHLLPPPPLSISAAPDQTILIKALGNGQASVYNYQTGGYFTYTIASIDSVSINLQGTDFVHIDDSNGMPFFPHTTIDLSETGSGSGLLYLDGSRAVSGNELYVAGGAPWTSGMIQMDNLTFTLEPGINGVYDNIPIKGTFDVQTSGLGVQLTQPNSGPYQLLTGLGNGGGGGGVEFSNKPTVLLEEYSSNANIFLDTTAAATGEHYFNVNMHEAGDNTTIDMTPNKVVTSVTTNVAPVANSASVSLWGNAAPVIINGNSSTKVSVGYPLGNGLDTTRGIKANVSVSGASSLSLSDDGNDSTHENVKVTNDTISGSGLFGTNSTTLFYGDVGTVNLITGQLADTYGVIGSQAGASFASQINITDFSNDSFQTKVTVDSASHLNLHMFNDTDRTGLIVLNVPSNGHIQGTENSGNSDTGTESVFFGLTDESEVFFQGYVVEIK